jgi:dihydroorotate dehydrogenase (fumarate)
VDAHVHTEPDSPHPTIDLSTTYLGLPLRSVLIASPSPLTGSIERLVELEAAGAGAVVLPSLFEEQLELEERLEQRVDTENRLIARGPDDVDLDWYNDGPAAYARLVQLARRRLRIPVIASINCARPASWPEFTRLLESAGADAIELNVYLLSADPSRSAAQIEDDYVALVDSVVRVASVPVAVKLAPFLTAPVHLAARLQDVGAAGIVMFHRLHDVEIDLQRRTAGSRLERSTPAELGLRLRWLGILRDRIDVSLAVTGGVWRGEDAAKAILAGADAVMLASVLLERGPSALSTIASALSVALDEAGFPSVSAARGVLALGADRAPAGADRAAYLRALLGASGKP